MALLTPNCNVTTLDHMSPLAQTNEPADTSAIHCGVTMEMSDIPTDKTADIPALVQTNETADIPANESLHSITMEMADVQTNEMSDVPLQEEVSDYPYTLKMGEEMEVLMNTLDMNKNRFKMLVPNGAKFQIVNNTDFILHVDGKILSTGKWTLISEYVASSSSSSATTGGSREDITKVIWLWSWGKYDTEETKITKARIQECLPNFKELVEGKVIMSEDPLFVSFLMATLTDIFKFEYMHVVYLGQEQTAHRFSLFGLKDLEFDKLRANKLEQEKKLDNVEALETKDFDFGETKDFDFGETKDFDFGETKDGDILDGQ